jgi:hypothetical protein
MKERTVKTVSGICRLCGCTDERACPGGCHWVNREHTLCSDCITSDRLVAKAQVEIDHWPRELRIRLGASDAFAIAAAIAAATESDSEMEERKFRRADVAPTLARLITAIEPAFPITARIIAMRIAAGQWSDR